jgi:hypothetical protein
VVALQQAVESVSNPLQQAAVVSLQQAVESVSNPLQQAAVVALQQAVEFNLQIHCNRQQWWLYNRQ